LSLKSKIGSELSEKSSFQAFHPAIDEHKIRCHGEGRPPKPCRDLPCCSLDDRRSALLLDEHSHALNCAAYGAAGSMPEPAHRPDNVMRARGFLGRHMSTGIHRGDQERNERIVSIQLAHSV
jgi:hypothetical protein